MPKSFITNKIDDKAAVENGKWEDIQAEAAKHRRSRVDVTSYSEEAEWSDQQRKWWKGVLLPALEKHTGDSIAYWETKLKLAVLPDDFAPKTVVIGKKTYNYVPSVSSLSMKKMNLLMEGSVAHLRDEDIYGDEFLWVTLPDKELRSGFLPKQVGNKSG